MKQIERSRVKTGDTTVREEIALSLWALVKWLAIAIACGIVIGGIGVLFHFCVDYATEARVKYGFLLYLLPVAGAAIALLYRLLAMEKDGGTNTVIASIRSEEELKVRMAPLIFVGTVLTHLCGGSSGREGAALQLGGSLGSQLGKWLRLDKQDQRCITLCGMSAAFAALFGTPLTAAIFVMEVVDVGTMYYAALIPCVIASLTACGLAGACGVKPTAFTVAEIPALGPASVGKTIILGILCAAISILFCVAIHLAGKYYQKFLPDSILRAAAGGVLVILVSLLLGTRDYNGAGMEVIRRALEGEAFPAAFLLKILLTALTLGAGFKGGEIVPAFFVGATFGCAAAPFLGLPPSFGAAAGIIAMFCGVTNCPVASLLLSFELFGGQGMGLFAAAVAVSYMLSGYFGLYHTQKFSYAKTMATRVGRNAR